MGTTVTGIGAIVVGELRATGYMESTTSSGPSCPGPPCCFTIPTAPLQRAAGKRRSRRCRCWLNIGGTYRLQLGPPLEGSYLVDVPSDWPEWGREWRPLPPDLHRDRLVGPDEAFLDVLPEGQVLIERALNRSTLLLPDKPRPEAWADPHLIGAWRLGRRSFHAGGFIVEGNVWGVLGERGDRKSSILAWLSANGYQVVCRGQRAT